MCVWGADWYVRIGGGAGGLERTPPTNAAHELQVDCMTQGCVMAGLYLTNMGQVLVKTICPGGGASKIFPEIEGRGK